MWVCPPPTSTRSALTASTVWTVIRRRIRREETPMPDTNQEIAALWRDFARRVEGLSADGKMPALSGGEGGWRTVSHLTGDQLASDRDGRFSIALSREPRPGNWLRLDDEASHVLVRQYFDDWEHEQPGVFTIVRED